MAGRGTALEAMVRASAEKARDAGLWLHQTSPRFIGRRTGPRGMAEGRVVAVGALDFIGDLRGRAVTLDAKSTRDATRFDLELVAGHQATLLKRAHARGAIAFLLVELDAAGVAPVYHAVDWEVLGPWWRGYSLRTGYGMDRPASIPAAVLAAEAVPVRRVRKTLDLVGAIETLAARVPRAGEG